MEQGSGGMGREGAEVSPMLESWIEIDRQIVVRAPDAAQRPFDGALQSRCPSLRAFAEHGSRLESQGPDATLPGRPRLDAYGLEADIS